MTNDRTTSPALARLASLGLELPATPRPRANYVSARRFGPLLYIAGQLPFVGGELPVTGKLGEDLDTATGVEQARLAALNSLAVAAEAVGRLDCLQLIQLMIFVASASDYYEQHVVANGASDLFVDVLGAAGQHVRTSIAVPCLPLNGPVEVQATFHVTEEESEPGRSPETSA